MKNIDFQIGIQKCCLEVWLFFRQITCSMYATFVTLEEPFGAIKEFRGFKAIYS